MNEKLDILKEHLSILDKTVTKTDFLKAFEDFLKIATAIEQGLVKKIDARLSKIEDGHTPTTSELLSLIRPLIPNIKDGETPSDARLRSLIAPLIPPPHHGVDGQDADEERIIQKIEGDLPKLGDSIRNGLELLPEGEKLKIEAIQDLRKELDELKKKRTEGGGTNFVISRGAIKLYDLSDSLNGVTKTFSLPAFWRVLTVQSSSTPTAFRPTTDYTTDGSLFTITFTSAIDASSTLAAGQTLTILYAEP